MQVECNGLLKECSALRSEKQDMVNKHQKEKSSLQSECASLRAEKEELLKTHQGEKASLQNECANLRSEKEAVLLKQQQMEKDLARSVLCVLLLRAQPRPPPLCSLWLTVHQQLLVQPAIHLSLFDLLFTEHCGDFLFVFLIACVPRMVSSATASKPSRSPKRSWRRDWQPCSSSTSRITPSYKPNLMRQTVTARLWKERYNSSTNKSIKDFKAPPSRLWHLDSTSQKSAICSMNKCVCVCCMLVCLATAARVWKR